MDFKVILGAESKSALLRSRSTDGSAEHEASLVGIRRNGSHKERSFCSYLLCLQHTTVAEMAVVQGESPLATEFHRVELL